MLRATINVFVEARPTSFCHLVKVVTAHSVKRSFTSRTDYVTPVFDMQTASLYVHWPYCRRKCSYCNFNKYVKDNVDHVRMRTCLQQETSHLIRNSSVQHITSVFFGGGTPSLAEAGTLGAVLETVSCEARLSPEAEVTMEINPTSMETDKLREFQLAGVTRASIGVQTLNDGALRILGRDHNSSDSLRCLEKASNIFQKQTSVDLMFGYPAQTVDMWRQELHQMLPLCDGHISLYQLTLERGTRLFKDVAAGSVAMPSADEFADMYLAAIEILASYGFEQYEVSNFAKGDCYSRHNIGYWTGQQYIGVGPGSHGRVWKTGVDGRRQRHACVQTLAPEFWMREVERSGHGTRKSTSQTTRDILEELLTVSLRTKWGLPEESWSALVPTSSLDQLASLPRTAGWIQQGFLLRTGQGLVAAPSGLLILDSILLDLLLDLDTLFTSHSLSGLSSPSSPPDKSMRSAHPGLHPV